MQPTTFPTIVLCLFLNFTLRGEACTCLFPDPVPEPPVRIQKNFFSPEGLGLWTAPRWRVIDDGQPTTVGV